MGERIKELRKALGITQQEFADKIKVSRNNVAGYEAGTRNPSDAVISLICREFSVNEEWLRNGTGEMIHEVSMDEQIASFIGDTLSGIEDSFKKRFISMLANLNEDEWELLEKMALELVKSDNKKED